MLALGLWNIRAEILVTLVTATIIVSPEKKSNNPKQPKQRDKISIKA